MTTPIGVAVVGCGYWGPNLVRNFVFSPESRVIACCDLDEARLGNISRLYPHVRTTTSYAEVLADPEIQAVVVATPVRLHHSMASQALKAGKHVLVEKPITASVREAKDLVALAKSHDLRLMVGHTFLYAPTVRKIRELIQQGELGEILYVRSSRMSLGLFQKDINVIWDLAPHDAAILLYILEPRVPQSVRAWGEAHVTPGIEDVANVEVHFGGNLASYLQLSWLDPRKTRTLTVVGNKKMLVYMDTSPQEPIRIYDTGVKGPQYYDSFGEFQYSYWYGDTYIPHVANTEPLKVEVGHFLECIRTGTEPLTCGAHALSVVEILEAADRSLKGGGGRVMLDGAGPLGTLPAA